jgi:ketosteroid isomerase-like protein
MDNDVQSETARRFIRALRTLEQEHDLGPMVELFSEDAQLTRLDGRGARGAREFWDEYLRTFGEISTTVTHATEGSAGVALEWRSQGTMPDGRGVDYVGASVLDIDGGLVTGLRSYYDSAAFTTERAQVGNAGDGGELEAGPYTADSGFESLADRAAARGDR